MKLMKVHTLFSVFHTACASRVRTLFLVYSGRAYVEFERMEVGGSWYPTPSACNHLAHMAQGITTVFTVVLRVQEAVTIWTRREIEELSNSRIPKRFRALKKGNIKSLLLAILLF